MRNDAPDDLTWLTEWYLAQCDEDWEQQSGITIDTLDNPGWSLSVDLDGTTLEGRVFSAVYDGVSAEEQPVQGGNGDVPWPVCRVDGTKFKAWGGPRDLGREENRVSIRRRFTRRRAAVNLPAGGGFSAD